MRVGKPDTNRRRPTDTRRGATAATTSMETARPARNRRPTEKAQELLAMLSAETTMDMDMDVDVGAEGGPPPAEHGITVEDEMSDSDTDAPGGPAVAELMKMMQSLLTELSDSQTIRPKRP